MDTSSRTLFRREGGERMSIHDVHVTSNVELRTIVRRADRVAQSNVDLRYYVIRDVIVI